MKFELIDYSEHYYTRLARGPVPANREGKFVQIRNGDKEYIILSPAGFSMYHGNIAEEFCKQNNLRGHWNTGKTIYEIEDRSWTIVGGGWWAIDTEKKTLDLGSSSQAYGRCDSAGLGDRIRALDSMNGYAVSTDINFFQR